MIPQYWSWVLAAIGVGGLYLAGSHRLIGWQIGLGVQALWVAYAIATHQWGFIASAVAFAGVNLRNLIKWRREKMGIKDWLNKKTEQGRKEIVEAVDNKLLEEQVEPTLRQHKGEPIQKPKDKS